MRRCENIQDDDIGIHLSSFRRRPESSFFKELDTGLRRCDVFYRFHSVSIELAARLNNDCHSAAVDRAALEQKLREQDEAFFLRISERCPHLFAAVPLFLSDTQVAQMRAVVEAIEQVVAMPAWQTTVLQHAPDLARCAPRAKGVFFGYDFHLNAEGAHLVEINTNAGGGFLNALLIDSQRGVTIPGEAAASGDLEQAFVEMFQNEWRLERGDAPLQTIAIVDEQPEEQFLYPEFVLAQRMFERAGITALIADPAELQLRADGLYCRERKVDLIYNRLTDFTLQQHPTLGAACQNSDLAVITPHPHAYALYADKYNLTLLTDAARLHVLGVADDTIAILQAGIPQTRVVRAEDAEYWQKERKQWFFKPATGFGSRGVYRGEKLTKRVFEEILQGGYVAQKFAPPGERMLCLEGAAPVPLKADVRCYVYDGQLQLVAARLYQGQATNFRTAGGGFAPVRIVSQ